MGQRHFAVAGGVAVAAIVGVVADGFGVAIYFCCMCLLDPEGHCDVSYGSKYRRVGSHGCESCWTDQEYLVG